MQFFKPSTHNGITKIKTRNRKLFPWSINQQNISKKPFVACWQSIQVQDIIKNKHLLKFNSFNESNSSWKIKSSRLTEYECITSSWQIMKLSIKSSSHSIESLASISTLWNDYETSSLKIILMENLCTSAKIINQSR